MMNPACRDSASVASRARSRRMSKPIECLAIDNDHQVRDAARRQEHLAATIRAGGHIVDSNCRF
jgi:hypothetical protein